MLQCAANLSQKILLTALVEVEGILNSKPFEYALADLAPIIPNILLMGQRDAALPQVVYTPAGTT